MKPYEKPAIHSVRVNASASIANRCWSQIHSEGASGQYIHDPNGSLHGWIVFSITSCNNTYRNVSWIPGYQEGSTAWQDSVDASSGNNVTYQDRNGNTVTINPLSIINNLLGDAGSDEHSWKGGSLDEIFDNIQDS